MGTRKLVLLKFYICEGVLNSVEKFTFRIRTATATFRVLVIVIFCMSLHHKNSDCRTILVLLLYLVTLLGLWMVDLE